MLGQWYLIELLKPAEQTSGGVWIPEKYQENWTHGIVRKVGPGEAWPMRADSGHRSSMWLAEGDEALFTKHSFRSSGAPHDLGVVRDEDLIAAVADNGLLPMNDWVMLDQDPDEPDPSPLIAYAEEYRPKPTHGVITGYGRGRVQRRGPLAGVRKPVPWVLGFTTHPGAEPVGNRPPIIGQRAWWSKECEVIAMGREHLEAVFVEASDLLFLEEDD